MLRPCHPPNVVLIVKILTGSRVRRVDELHAVVVDEDVCGPALHFVRGNGSLKRANGWFNDRPKTFFVDGTLDRHMGKRPFLSVQSLWWFAGIVFCIPVHLTDGPNKLSDVSDESLEEELENGQHQRRFARLKMGSYQGEPKLWNEC